MNDNVAARLSRVGESATAVVAARARQLQREGRDVISLAEGELDFSTPEHIRAAGIRAIEEGDTRYTDVPGRVELKEAVREKFRRENGLEYTLDQVTAGAGAKQLIFNAMMATLDPGDEVVIPAPCWVSYVDIVNLCGGTPKLLPCTEEAGFKPDPAALDAAVTDATRWLILNSPNNPSGAVYSHAELEALAGVLERHPRVMVLCDDIYEHIVFDGRFATLARVAPQLAHRVLTLNGVSKVFSMTGWRIGYAGGPDWLIRAMNVIQSQSTNNPTSISQAAAIGALSGSLDFFTPRLAALRDRRDRIVKAIADSDRLKAAAPAGAFYVFANCRDMLGARTPGGAELKTDVDVAEYFLDHAGLAMVPGGAFNTSPYLRIAFALADHRLDEACTRMLECCRALD